MREIKSKNSYMVELDGVRRHIHADKLRKYHVQVDEVCCDLAECSIVVKVLDLKDWEPIGSQKT